MRFAGPAVICEKTLSFFTENRSAFAIFKSNISSNYGIPS